MVSPGLSGAAEKPRLPIALIAVCAVSLIGALIVVITTLAPKQAVYATKTTDTTANPNATDSKEWLKQKARESGGDVTKLSAEDRVRLDRMTRGRSELVLRMTAQNL
jgi:threonine dehydrogenase-like Zn-dependent dehydrogenase